MWITVEILEGNCIRGLNDNGKIQLKINKILSKYLSNNSDLPIRSKSVA